MTWPLLLLALIVIDPDAMTIDPGDFTLMGTTTSITVPTESTTTTSDTATSTSESSTTFTSTSLSVGTTSTTVLSGAEWFVATTGSDASGDGSHSHPYQTTTKALTRVAAGDRIVLLPNPDSSSHRPFIADGHSDLTITCEIEGQCAILSTGATYAVQIKNAHDVVLSGLALSSTDRTTADVSTPNTLEVRDATRITIRRTIVLRNNRYFNAHPIAFSNVTDSTIVETACLEHSRHCISLSNSTNIHVLRNWIHNRGRKEVVSNPPGGTSRESIACYPCFHSLFANNLIEGSKGWGINVNATKPMPENHLIGNITVGTYLGGKVYSRPTGWPIDTLVQDHVVARVNTSFDFRDQVSINTRYERLTFFAGVSPFEVDNPVHDDASQLDCTEVGGTPSITIRDSLLGTLVIEACTGITRGCTVANTIATSKTIMAGCSVSGVSSTLPAALGDSGAGKALVLPIDGRGADVRCVIDDDGTRTHEDLWDVSGQWRYCPPVRAGWNDAGDTCATYGKRRLNHKPDGTGAPLAQLACPD